MSWIDPTDGRPSASERGYDADWREVRDAHLAANPWCQYCLELGVQTAATLVDHIQPISRRPELRLERSNLKSACVSCNNRKAVADILGEKRLKRRAKRNQRE